MAALKGCATTGMGNREGLGHDMTEESARRIANIVLAAAAVGATYVVVTTPPLRRLAWRLAAVALTGAIPAWLQHEVKQAWAESGRSRLPPPAIVRARSDTPGRG